jgi:hypothetical protein
MTREELYAHFKVLALSRPNLLNWSKEKEACDSWWAKLLALVEFEGDATRIVRLRSIVRDLNHCTIVKHQDYVRDGDSILQQCIAKLEYSVEPSAQGKFIQSGSPLQAHKAVSSILASAQTNLLVVDPYLDQKILTEYALSVDSSVTIQLLTDKDKCKPDLFVAYRKWRQEHGLSRPLQIKLAKPYSLHDRLIVCDNAVVWLVTQSIKDLANTSPASILQVDPETSALKLKAYDDIWLNAETRVE